MTVGIVLVLMGCMGYGVIRESSCCVSVMLGRDPYGVTGDGKYVWELYRDMVMCVYGIILLGGDVNDLEIMLASEVECVILSILEGIEVNNN